MFLWLTLNRTLIWSQDCCADVVQTHFTLVWFILYCSIMILARNPAEDDTGVLRPANTIAKVGDTITLLCTSRVNNESRWEFYSIDGLKLTNIYNGNRFLADLKRGMTTNFSSCNLKACPLTIKSVQFEDAGYYVCFESSSPDRQAASLTVLGRSWVRSQYTFLFVVTLWKIDNSAVHYAVYRASQKVAPKMFCQFLRNGLEL